MAEIGIVASIIGVAGAGFRLSLILNAVGCEIANAPLEIHQISKTVTLFALMLKQTGNVLQANDSVHSREAVEAAQQVANESTRVFDEIREMLDKVRTKYPDGSLQPSVQQRFKWCFKRNRVSYLVAQLESLKLSLSLMLQILQLGKLMASTSKTDTPEQVKNNTAAIQQERAEAQNTVIIRFIQIREVDRLFRVAEDADKEPPATSPISESSQLTLEPPPEYKSSSALIRLPLHSLGHVDQILASVQNSSKDMVRSSNQAIDPLLEKWTRWHDVREGRHRHAASRYVPKVDLLTEDDEDLQYHRRFQDRNESPRGFYLEGATTDWRRPHSVEARREAAARRKKYSGYQPSVSIAGTDVEDSPESNSSHRRRQSRRHVINSSSDSSDSEPIKVQRRRDSVVSSQAIRPGKVTPELVTSTQGTQSPQNTQNAQKPFSSTPQAAALAPSGLSISPPTSRAIPPPPSYTSPYASPVPPHRPYVTPDQQMLHHSMSLPLPPIHTSNAPNPYSDSPISPGLYHPPPYGFAMPQARQFDRGYSSRILPPRPRSRDGPVGRSPSRLSYEPSGNEYYKSRDDRFERNDRSDRRDDRRDDRKDDRRDDKKKPKDKTKNLRDGAAKGLIGAGAIAGFLEALEGLSL